MTEYVGFSWWSSGEEPSCQCRGHGFNPWSGKIPHATRQLSPHASELLKPACLEPVPCNDRSHHNEKPAHRNEEWSPLTTARESLCMAMKTSAAKKKNKKERKCMSKELPPESEKPSNSEDGPADAFTAALITLLLSTFLCLIRPPPPSRDSLVPDEERRTFAFHTSASFHF